jgi:putative endonuclease
MEEDWFVYAIASLKNRQIYVGMTQNIERRIKEHNNGHTKSTRAYIPWELFFTEKANGSEQARTREKYWKSGIGKEKLKIILSTINKNNWPHSSTDRTDVS